MTYAQIISSQPVALNPSSAVTFEREGQTINASYQTVMLWSDDERAAIGVYPIVDDTIPEGKVATGSTLENDNGAVRRRWVLADAPPPPVPQSISDRQFFHMLAKLGTITKDEALAAVKTGEIPAALQAFVAAIPDEDDRFDAEMLLSGAVEFRFDHPLTPAIAAANGWQHPAETGDFFRQAAQL